jgi:hypothetical protein
MLLTGSFPDSVKLLILTSPTQQACECYQSRVPALAVTLASLETDGAE